MDLTMHPARGNSIQAYGADGFRINGVDYAGGVLVSESLVAPLAPTQLAALSPADLAPLLEAAPPVEVLIIGSGARTKPLPAELRQALRARAIRADVMDTGAACRTYAIMHSEGRRVGAALLVAAA